MVLEDQSLLIMSKKSSILLSKGNHMDKTFKVLGMILLSKVLGVEAEDLIEVHL